MTRRYSFICMFDLDNTLLKCGKHYNYNKAIQIINLCKENNNKINLSIIYLQVYPYIQFQVF